MNGERDTGPVRSAVARLAARAAPLCERLLDREWPASAEGSAPAPSALVDDYLRRWRRVVADDDETLFARRLAWDGLTESGVRRLLEGSRGRLTPSGWVESLAE